MINHPNRPKFVQPAPIAITEDIARKVIEIVDAGLVKGVGNPKAGQMCVEAAVCYAMGLPHGDDPQCVSRALRSLKIRLNDSNWSSNAARAKGLRRLAVAQLGSRDVLDDREFVKRVAKLTIQTCMPTALRAVASIQKNQDHAQALRDAANVCEREGTRESALAAKKAIATAYAATAIATAYVTDAAYTTAYAATAYVTDATAADATATAYATAAAADAAADATADATAYADAVDAIAEKRKMARDTVLSDFAEGVVQILIKMKAPGCQWLALTE